MALVGKSDLAASVALRAIGGSAGASGAYGGKDIRQKKGSGATPGVFAKPRTALEEEESWD